MALDWVTGALGFAAGSASSYQEQAKKQREWNLEQSAKDAELERKLHFEKVGASYKTDEALRQQKLLQEQQMTPESQAYLDMKDRRAIGLERDKAVAAEKGKYQVLGSEEVQGYMDQDYKRRLTESVGLLKAENDEKIRFMDAQTKDAIGLINSNPDLTDEQKATMTWKTQAAAKGIKIPDSVKLTPENILKAQELAISRTKDIDDDTAAKIIQGLTGKVLEDKKGAASRLTDFYTNATIQSMNPIKKGKITTTPQAIADDLKSQTQAERVKQLNILKKNDPDTYKIVVPLLTMDATTTVETPEAKKSSGGGMLSISGPRGAGTSYDPSLAPKTGLKGSDILGWLNENVFTAPGTDFSSIQ